MTVVPLVWPAVQLAGFLFGLWRPNSRLNTCKFAALFIRIITCKKKNVWFSVHLSLMSLEGRMQWYSFIQYIVPLYLLWHAGIFLCLNFTVATCGPSNQVPFNIQTPHKVQQRCENQCTTWKPILHLLYLFMVAQHNINFRSINWQHLDPSPFLSIYPFLSTCFTERHNEILHFWVAGWTLMMFVGPLVPLTSVCRWVWVVQEILWVQTMMSQETEIVFSRSVYFI